MQINVSYTFELKNSRHMFPVTTDLLDDKNTKYSQSNPAWALLEHNQCPNCPLDAKTCKYCPAAESIVDIVDFFSSLKSFENTKCSVEHDGVTITSIKPIQDTLYSLMGLRFASSTCPFFKTMRPMARFHAPFADDLHTTYRAASMFLLRQFFKNSSGGTIEMSMELLKGFYKNINIVNLHLSKRLQSSEISDAAPNCLVVLDNFAYSISSLIDENLEQLKSLFDIK